MKRFLIRFALFVLPIAAGAILMDNVVTRGLKVTGYRYFAEWNDIFEGRAKSDLVINGTSRAWVHISPKIIEDETNCKSYNLGMDGQSFHMQYQRYRAYEKYNGKPKYVIQTMRESTLSKSENLTDYQQFLPYLDEAEISGAAAEYNVISKWDGSILFHRYIGEYNLVRVGILEYFDIRNYSNGKYRGYLGIDRAWNGEALDQMKKTGLKSTINLDGDNIRVFESFLKHTKNSDIKLILVYPPQFIEGQAFVANKAQLRKTYAEIAARHQVPLLDYSKDPISYNKEFFYNAMHLNKAGSELFTRKLVSDMSKEFGYNLRCN